MGKTLDRKTQTSTKKEKLPTRKEVDEDVSKRLEEIAYETAKEVLGLRKGLRPSKIYLFGAGQEYLTSLVVKLGLKFKEYEERTGEEVDIKIFTGLGDGYFVDIGHYLNSSHSKVS